MDVAAAVQTIGGVASVVVAAAALVVAFRVEKRTASRFQMQMDVTERITAASIQPVLGILTSEFMDYKAIKIINYGTGTAVITASEICKDGRRVRNMAQLFEFDRPIIWKNYWTFPESDFYLRSGQELTLASITHESVEKQFDGSSADSVMEAWQKQLDGIEIKLSYRDVARLREYEYRRTLKS
ncbi:hypothetical protein ACPFP2_25865 [Micromonospora citrea]|uniref:hypothetical protein n=1 Tax=Micromonospora citrea TaxID=47855 RepID=UPI003C61D419